MSFLIALTEIANNFENPHQSFDTFPEQKLSHSTRVFEDKAKLTCIHGMKHDCVKIMKCRTLHVIFPKWLLKKILS